MLLISHRGNVNGRNPDMENNPVYIHCFWHQEDDVVLTSMGYIWTYPNKEATDASICVLLNKNDKIPKNSFGICSDYVIIYKEQLQRIIYE